MVNTTCKGNTINNVSNNVKDACLRILLSFNFMGTHIFVFRTTKVNHENEQPSYFEKPLSENPEK